MLRVKERLERCCKSQHGWNYVPVSDHRIIKGNKEEFSLIEFTGLVCGTLGLTCFGGSLFICLVSLIVHLHLWFKGYMMFIFYLFTIIMYRAHRINIYFFISPSINCIIVWWRLWGDLLLFYLLLRPYLMNLQTC